MRLRHIEVFHAIYTTGSMTRAAEVLHVSQPSISKVLAHAESQLGFRLFDRSRGKLVATNEAERLFPHILELYGNLNAVRRVAANLREPAEGTIRIASTPALGMEMLPSAVASYLTKNPLTSFDLLTLHQEEITTALTEARVDIGLSFDAKKTPGVELETLRTGQFVLVAPLDMKIAGSPPYSFEEIADLPLIQLDIKTPLGQLLHSQFDLIDKETNVVAVTETYQIAKVLAAQGAGVAVVDEITANTQTDSKVQILPIQSDLEFSVSLMRLDRTPLTRICRGFVNHLRQELLS